MKRIILVAGIDYYFDKVDFRRLCDRRESKLIEANSVKEEMAFYIFDFSKGEIVIDEVTYPGLDHKVTIKRTIGKTFKPISQSNYDPVTSGGDTYYHFKPGQKDTLSILDVYSAVRSIGETSPGTLFELSFFSHSFEGGPILVNSFEPPPPAPLNYGLLGTIRLDGLRHPDDKDPRVKDFTFPNMDATALDNFQKAFRKDGYVWVWGCLYAGEVHEILSKIEKNSSYKTSGIGDKTNFHFKNLNSALVDNLESVLLPTLGIVNKRDFTITFDYIKLYFFRLIANCYTQHIAIHSKVKTFGAPLGTDAIYEKNSLMRVNPVFSSHFTFYQNHLNFKFDPEGRKYIEYKPNFSFTIPV